MGESESDQLIAARLAYKHLSKVRIHLRMAAAFMDDATARDEIADLLANQIDSWRWKAEQIVREAKRP